jgi:1-aminocyclopropane-1-carboxylate deaminase/D-cysteine desulfhydrase-like pyridoxal-dependent ACC family enzyme
VSAVYPLFAAHPALAVLPRAGLLRAPTRIDALAGQDGVWVKRDDLSSDGFGGNKIRKLDLLLADARARDKRTLLAFGYSGSNFVAATAWHGRQLGFDTIGLLLPQAPAPYVGDNLAMALQAGASLHLGDTTAALVRRAVTQSLARLAREHRWPYWLPPGGSTPLGALGFVNAAFELREQIERGELPKPARLYVAFSSMGTVAGLAIGLAMAGIDCRIQAVQVVDDRFASRRALDTLIARTQRLLRRYIPGVATAAGLVDIRTEHFGPGYAQASADTHAAMQRFTQDGGARSDSAYTGKALTALYADRDRGLREPVLYWHSFNAHPLPAGVTPLAGDALKAYLLDSDNRLTS